MAIGKKFTYNDLAKRTGISIATISRVMNRSLRTCSIPQ